MVKPYTALFTALPGACTAPSSFITYTKKKGVFIRGISVSPSHFLWKNHSIKVDESWLQRNSDGPYCVYFVLKVDGILEQNLFPDEGWLEFVDENEDERIVGIGRTQRCTKLGQLHKYLTMIPFFPPMGHGKGSYVIHGLEFALEAEPADIVRLRATSANIRVQPTIEEIVLTFDLRAPSL